MYITEDIRISADSDRIDSKQNSDKENQKNTNIIHIKN